MYICMYRERERNRERERPCRGGGRGMAGRLRSASGTPAPGRSGLGCGQMGSTLMRSLQKYYRKVPPVEKH